DLDRVLVELIRACLAPDPADRPADAAEVARRIADYRKAREASGRQTRSRDRFQRIAGLVTAAAALVASALVGATARDLHARGWDLPFSRPAATKITPTGSPTDLPACPPSAVSW